MKLRPFSTGSTALSIALLAGCRVGPDYESPEITMPDQWSQELTEGVFQDNVDLGLWWKLLRDPMLDELIKRAVENNHDLHMAFTRVLEARSRFGIAVGTISPDIDAAGSYERYRASTNDPLVPFGTGGQDRSSFIAGLDMTWEIDLWGRVSRTIEAAGTAFQASIEDHRDAGVTLFAEVSSTYVALRTLQARLAIARTNVQTQTQALDLARSRLDAALAPELDVAQAETNLAMTEATIPPLRKAIVLTMNRLATLLGEPPGTLREELEQTTPIPTPPDRLVASLPANLLRQRPDVRAAERRLASQNAQIGIATAELYPNFALTGTIGWDGDQLDDWLTATSRFYSIGPQFRWNLFDGGRVRNLIEVQNARTHEALELYEKTVLLALEEVEGAMTSFAQSKLEQAALERAVAAAKRASSLSLDLYRTNVRTFQDVLDAQRDLAGLEDRLAVVRGQVTDAMIHLYKALGGGWARPQPPAEETEEKEAEKEPAATEG